MKKLYIKIKTWIKLDLNTSSKRKKTARDIIRAMEFVKKALESKSALILVSVIPGNFDEKIRKAIIKHLDVLLPTIKILSQDMKNAVIHKTASLAYSDITGTEIKKSDLIIQSEYVKLKAV